MNTDRFVIHHGENNKVVTVEVEDDDVVLMQDDNERDADAEVNVVIIPLKDFELFLTTWEQIKKSAEL